MNSVEILERLANTIESRKGAEAGTSYVASLHAKGIDAILKKVGEEATETILAAKGNDKLHIVKETADLCFHTVVMLSWHGLTPNDVLDELAKREGVSGITEKLSRNQK